MFSKYKLIDFRDEEWKGKMQSTITGNDQVRILFSAEIPFKCREKIKTFPDKQKLREFIISRFAPKTKQKQQQPQNQH